MLRRFDAVVLNNNCGDNFDENDEEVYNKLLPDYVRNGGGLLSEALNLRLQDVELGQRMLTVVGTKFGKSRLVPIHASTQKGLAKAAPNEGVWRPFKAEDSLLAFLRSL